MSKRGRSRDRACVAVAAILLGVVPQAAGQGRGPYSRATSDYGGFIGWLAVTTGVTEVVLANVTAGRVDCGGWYQDPERGAPISGRGLLNITLGKSPSGDTAQSSGGVPQAVRSEAAFRRFLQSLNLPVPTGGKVRPGKVYSFEVACPNAQYTPVGEAKWSEAINSYDQPGGEVGLDPKTLQPVLPDTLRGFFSDINDDGTGGMSGVTMAWLLCRGCTPSAAAAAAEQQAKQAAATAAAP